MPKITNITKQGLTCTTCGGDILIEGSQLDPMHDDEGKGKHIADVLSLVGQCNNGHRVVIQLTCRTERL